MWRGGSVPSVPAQVAEPGWLLPGRERLPILVPHGCHADPQAVFADVIFDFTRLELQLRHFATQGCHDSQPHVPRVAHTLGEGGGASWLPPPQQKSTQNPLGGGQECGAGKHLRDRLTSTFCDGETEVWVARIHFPIHPPSQCAPPTPCSTPLSMESCTPGYWRAEGLTAGPQQSAWAPAQPRLSGAPKPLVHKL